MRDVAWMTKAGIIIDVPARWPDLSEPDEVVEEVQALALADHPESDAVVDADAAREAAEGLHRWRRSGKQGRLGQVSGNPTQKGSSIFS